MNKQISIEDIEVELPSGGEIRVRDGGKTVVIVLSALGANPIAKKEAEEIIGSEIAPLYWSIHPDGTAGAEVRVWSDEDKKRFAEKRALLRKVLGKSPRFYP